MLNICECSDQLRIDVVEDTQVDSIITNVLITVQVLCFEETDRLSADRDEITHALLYSHISRLVLIHEEGSICC